MSRVRPVAGLTTALFAVMPIFSSAAAPIQVNLEIDLDEPGVIGFFINPDPNYSVTIDLTDSPITVNTDDQLDISISFVDQQTGAKQHLEVFDDPASTSGPDSILQDISANLFGPSILPYSAFFRLVFTGVIGDLPVAEFETSDGLCTEQCNSFPLGADLTSSSFLFHGFDITFQPLQPGRSAFEFNAISFGGAADRVAVGTWTVPEPASLALFGFGFSVVAFARRRHRHAAPAKAF